MTTRLSRLAGIWAAAMLMGASGCGDTCEAGAQCERDCPPGGVAICAAHGLCACLLGPDGGVYGDEIPGASPADAPDPTAPDTGLGVSSGACAAPGRGDLIINELLLDGEPTEDAEFVELINPGPAPIAVAGLELVSNRGAELVRRVVFTGGCLPGRAAVALYAERASWVESTIGEWPLTAELRSFGFANGGDFIFELRAGEQIIDRLEGAGDWIAPGVSLNRDPDLTGSALSAHDMLDRAGRPASPGRCPGGGRYEDECVATDPGSAGADAGPNDERLGDGGQMPDAGPTEPDAFARDAGAPAPGPRFDCPALQPGELRINEVLIDGRIPRTEADEFVEVVSTADGPRRLNGVTLATEGPDGRREPRVVFVDGCLPAHGVIVLHPEPGDWRYLPPVDPAPVLADARLALGNESRLALALLDGEGALLDRFDPSDLLIVEGVSLNRSPDLSGEQWTLHDRMAGAESSPGTCAGGEAFGPDGCPTRMVEGCVVPTPERLVINEVLIDGVVDGEVDEFIELVNPSADPVALDGLGLWSSRRDGVLVERVAFDRGCLLPGGVAIFGARADWRGLGGVPLDARVERLALPNDAPVTIELRPIEGPTWGITLPAGISLAGVSAVREREGDPDADFVPHDTVAEQPASPGSRANGDPLASDGRWSAPPP